MQLSPDTVYQKTLTFFCYRQVLSKSIVNAPVGQQGMVRLVFIVEGVLVWEPQQEVFRYHIGKLWKGSAEQASFFSGLELQLIMCF